MMMTSAPVPRVVCSKNVSVKSLIAKHIGKAWSVCLPASPRYNTLNSALFVKGQMKRISNYAADDEEEDGG